MSLSVLNNVASLVAQNQLTITNGNLQKALFQLSSGSRINTGADDAAGLAIADGLHANITALTQSARNANDGVGELQVADGSLAAVTTLLNRAVTIATEAATGTVSDAQRVALNDEFTAIKSEIDRVGSKTNYNGGQVFTANTLNVFLSDAGAASNTHPSLASVLAANPTAVQNFFQNSSGSGFANSFNNDLVNLTDPTEGVITVDLAGNNAQQTALTKQINDLQDRLSAESATLTLQFDRVNATLESYPSLLLTVTAEIGALNGNYNTTSTAQTNTAPAVGNAAG